VGGKYVLRVRLELAFGFVADGTQEVDIRFVKVIFVGIGICERCRTDRKWFVGNTMMPSLPAVRFC